jgi:flagellar biosynthesis/type III secretory pathway M-ring protein FliF/YscJ
MAAMVSLVLAYVGIIGAFIFDFVRIRPLRNKMEAAAKGLTEKKRQAIIDEDYAEAERRRVEKEARKQAKRSK